MRKKVITIDELIEKFRSEMNSVGSLSKSTINSYCTAIRRISKEKNMDIVEKLGQIISDGRSQLDNNLKTLMNDVDTILANNYTGKEQTDFKCGFRKFVQCILGLYFAELWLNISAKDFELCKLIAANALFASKEIVDKVKSGEIGAKNNIGKGNKWASWDNMLHVRDLSCDKNTKLSDGHLADDNIIANHAIKKAVLLSQTTVFSTSFDCLDGYEACHVWDRPKDPTCYASIANLVLLPRALGQLTDHCDAIKDLLHYEVYKRFQFIPDGELRPSKPTYYDKIKWRS